MKEATIYNLMKKHEFKYNLVDNELKMLIVSKRNFNPQDHSAVTQTDDIKNEYEKRNSYKSGYNNFRRSQYYNNYDNRKNKHLSNNEINNLVYNSERNENE